MNKTPIEWTDYTWNPVTGCHKVSHGCKNCYAETLTVRFGKQWSMKSFRDVQTHPDRLTEPLEMRNRIRGKKVFVCDMSDLFHESVPFEFIAKVFIAMALCPETIFQVLTKRVDRALQFFAEYEYFGFGDQRTTDELAVDFHPYLYDKKTHQLRDDLRKIGWYWDYTPDEFGGDSRLTFENDEPLKNVWIGTSCEDQNTANERIPLLLKVPTKVRFLSCEPLIGKIDVSNFLQHPSYHSLLDGIHWVIAGGESGRAARPMNPEWPLALRDECEKVGVPFFFKQWGEYMPMENVQPGPLSVNRLKQAGSRVMYRSGKTKAGNVLDGNRYLQFPKTQA